VIFWFFTWFFSWLFLWYFDYFVIFGFLLWFFRRKVHKIFRVLYPFALHEELIKSVNWKE